MSGQMGGGAVVRGASPPAEKDTDGFTEVLQVPVDGPQAVPQLVGAPVELVPTHLQATDSRYKPSTPPNHRSVLTVTRSGL